MKNRNTQAIIARWQQINVRVNSEHRKLTDGATVHIEVRSVKPFGVPLPIAATGFRSHDCSPAEVDAAGGPVAYVLGWLETEAQSPAWKAAELARRQLSLF